MTTGAPLDDVLPNAVLLYRARFGKDPVLLRLDPERYLARVRRAVEDGIPIDPGEQDPEDVEVWT